MFWAEDPQFDEFFRQGPPVIEWRSVAAVQELFGRGFFVYQGSQAVGYASLEQVDRRGKEANFCILLDRDKVTGSRRKLTKEVLEELLNYGFNDKNYTRVSARILASHHEWKDTLIEWGFKQEALFRKSFKGEDELLLTILDEEFIRWQP